MSIVFIQFTNSPYFCYVVNHFIKPVYSSNVDTCFFFLNYDPDFDPHITTAVFKINLINLYG